LLLKVTVVVVVDVLEATWIGMNHTLTAVCVWSCARAATWPT